MANQNLWTWKDSELMAELDRMGIPYDRAKFGRKTYIDLIMKSRLDRGEVKEMLVEIDGTEQPIGPGIEQLKRENPKLIISKVIFHNTSENDMPYVFVGHNGTAFYIPKETEVLVPDYILNSCIKDAIEDRLYPETQKDGSVMWKVRRVQRFPYSVIKPSFVLDD